MSIELQQIDRHTLQRVENQMLWNGILVHEICCSYLDPIFSYQSRHEIIYNMHYYNLE